MEILKYYEIDAVFFVTGEWLEQFSAQANMILEQGQSLGNQAYSHQSLLVQEERAVKKQIDKFNQLCIEKLDYYPLFFRPPYGEYNSRIVRIAEELGNTTLLWSINPCVIPGQESDYILTRFEERLHDGAILLFHTSPECVEVLPEIIEFILWKDYEIGSPSSLLKQR